MNILIIEDEKRNYNRLKRLLEEIDYTLHIDGPTTSIVETVAYLQSHPAPDLILADIRLTDGLSFDALAQVNVQAPVIFTTAYDEYAIRAFKYNGIDYLLKPIDADELATALQRARKLHPSDSMPTSACYWSRCSAAGSATANGSCCRGAMGIGRCWCATSIMSTPKTR